MPIQITFECDSLIFLNSILFLLVNKTASWEDNWVYSEHSGVEFGKFKLTAGKFYDDESNKGKYTFYIRFLLFILWP